MTRVSNCMVAPTESKICTTDQTAWIAVRFYKLHITPITMTRLTLLHRVHQYHPLSQPYSWQWWECLWLWGTSATGERQCSCTPKKRIKVPLMQSQTSREIVWSCGTLNVGHIPFKKEQCSDSQYSYLWSRPISSLCSASLRLNKHLWVNSPRLLYYCLTHLYHLHLLSQYCAWHLTGHMCPVDSVGCWMINQQSCGKVSFSHYTYAEVSKQPSRINSMYYTYYNVCTRRLHNTMK